jgi:hypothetical protein
MSENSVPQPLTAMPNPITKSVETATKKANPLANYFRQPKLYIKLPSKGEFYPAGSLDISEIGEYAVYAMTAKDELMFKTPDALMNGSATIEVIKSCVPSILNPWQMPSIDMDAVLIAIRIATYGDEMDISTDCPQCGSFNDYGIDLTHYLDHAMTFQYQSELTVGPLIVHLRPYSYKEITKTAVRTLEQQKIINIVTSEDLSEEDKVEKFGQSFIKLTELTVDVITGCISRIDTPEGSVDDPIIIKEFIANTSADIFNTISDHVIKLKDDIALKTSEVACAECEHKFKIELTLDQTNFFAKGS